MHSSTKLIIMLLLLLASCTRPPPAEQVADEFVQAYFVQSDVAAAVKLASGRAKASLSSTLQQIEAAGAKEPAKDLPRVKVSLAEKQPVGSDAVRFVYRIDPEVAEVQPITAILQLTKEGGSWYVTEFSQSP